MRKIKGLRWYMIALVTLGTVLGYLTRNTVAAAAPTLMEELHISTQQYPISLQPIPLPIPLCSPSRGMSLIFWGPKLAMPSSPSHGRYSAAQRRWPAAGVDWRWPVAQSAQRRPQ